MFPGSFGAGHARARPPPGRPRERVPGRVTEPVQGGLNARRPAGIPSSNRLQSDHQQLPFKLHGPCSEPLRAARARARRGRAHGRPRSAGSPIVIPHPTFPQCTPDGPQGTDTLNAPALPEDTQCYPMPGVPIISTQYSAIVTGGYMSLQGAIEKDGYQVIWDDLGSGTPVIQGALHRWVFPLPGLYGWHCSCTNPGTRADGRIYVVGPAPRINPIMTSRRTIRRSATRSTATFQRHRLVAIQHQEVRVGPNEDGVSAASRPISGSRADRADLVRDRGRNGVGLRVTDDFMSGDPLMPTPRTVEAVITINVPKPTTGGGPSRRRRTTATPRTSRRLRRDVLQAARQADGASEGHDLRAAQERPSREGQRPPQRRRSRRQPDGGQEGQEEDRQEGSLGSKTGRASSTSSRSASGFARTR